MSKIQTVVIVGRINVGKSSLFNRLTESSKALVSPIVSTTRDYNRGRVFWRKKSFELIDTGGVNIDILKNGIQALLPGKKSKQLLKADTIEKEIVLQTKAVLNKADLILMVTDVRSGLLAEDKELALVLKKIKTPVMLVSNKADSQKWRNQINEFYKLGLGQPYAVSAANGSGTGDLLDEVVKKIKGQAGRPKKAEEQKPIRVAIIGKPNVGKSSLVNKILGENRVIISDIPQTTREPQDTEIEYNGQKIILIDTAGLRRKSKIGSGLEKLATNRTLGMINYADIILLVTEVDQPLVRQDSFLTGLIKNSGAGLIVVANKWDLLPEKSTKTDSQIKKYYQQYFPYLSFAPLIFTSAKLGKNVDKILSLVVQVAEQRQKEIPAAELKEVLKKITRMHHPVQAKGKRRPYLINLEQIKTNPPLFIVTIGANQSIHFSYLRYIENQLRQHFDFIGVPMNIKVKAVES